MSKEPKAISFKHTLQHEVAYQLEHSLGKLKDLLGEKKFKSRVKKAVKLFTEGIKKEEKKPGKQTDSKALTKQKVSVSKDQSEAAAKKSPAKAPAKKAPAKKPVAVKKAVAAKPKASADA